MSEMSDQDRRKRRTLLLLAGLAVGMFGFGFAMVPLYGLLCQITGTQSIEQRTAIANAAPGTGAAVNAERWVTVKLDVTVHPDLPWSLAPTEPKLRVRPGEPHVVTFVAENRSGSKITGQAIPSINPWQATPYFAKMECFCFTQQTLEGNQRRDMPLRFVVSPDLPKNIDSLTLSYSVMRVSGPDAVAAAR